MRTYSGGSPSTLDSDRPPRRRADRNLISEASHHGTVHTKAVQNQTPEGSRLEWKLVHIWLDARRQRQLRAEFRKKGTGADAELIDVLPIRIPLGLEQCMVATL